MASTEPPAGNGTTSRIGLLGQVDDVCALIGRTNPVESRAAASITAVGDAFRVAWGIPGAKTVVSWLMMAKRSRSQMIRNA